MKLDKEIIDALARVQTAFPEAVIAGGYLRDRYLGETPKDIDVFVWSRGGDKTEALLAEALGTKVTRIDKEFAEKYEENFSDLDAVFDGPEITIGPDQDDPFAETYRLQIIAMTRPFTPESIMERFDFGLCQIVYDGNTLMMTPAFIHDVRAQTFTMTRDPNERDLARSKERFERISSRIRGEWKMINPYAAAMFD